MSTVDSCDWITPGWNAPATVRAISTTRSGGVSAPPYDSLNLGDHVGDDGRHVAVNRRRLRERLVLPSEPRWLRQVHGNHVIAAHTPGTREADGAFTTEPGVVCAVMTADCLPVLMCDRAGTRVAALHAGWRGLAAGIVEEGVRALSGSGADLIAWLGPAIGPRAFEVGAEVRDTFIDYDPAAESAFSPSRFGRWLADLYDLAGQRLRHCGVEAVSGGGFCTYSDKRRFFSYRRDGVTGRAATLIWLEGALR